MSDVHLFDVSMRYLSIVEYGYTVAQRAAGIPIPAGGARFDAFFEGRITGQRLSGELTGVDYVRLDPDGTAHLHVHAHITTHDGYHIAVHCEGTAQRRVSSSTADVLETVSFATAADDYRWLNGLSGAARGVADMEAGTSEIAVVARLLSGNSAADRTAPGLKSDADDPHARVQV
jgi:hypothetical protein